MNSRMQHLLRTTSNMLVLAVLLSGLLSGPTSSVTAREAWQEPPPNRVAQGYGNFPRLPVVAPGEDGATLALYLVEGDTATQLVTLEGTRAGSNRADARLSPDGRYAACLRTEGEYMRSVLEVVDTQEAQRVVIAEGPKGEPRQRAAWEELASVAWMDAEHILYSKVQWPSSQEREASWEAGTPLPVKGEIWLSDVGGKEQRLLANGRIYRVLGASPEGQTLYVTRLIPGHEEDREEGFALVDIESGKMTKLWPEEERGGKRYLNFKLVVLPDGAKRLLFTTRDWGDSAATEPPVIWMGDPESGQAEAIWTIDRGKDWSKGEMTGTIYDTPRDFLWSPRSEHEFIYLAGDVLGDVWHVDLETGKAEPLEQVETLGRAAVRLLAWAPEGIVIQSQDVIRLLDENGEVRGEIHFGKDEERSLAPSQVSSVVVDWDVPYVHQIYDTPAWFHGGWACGPTSVVMALAYYSQLSGDYGWYVPNEYTHQSACSGEHTFDTERIHPWGVASGAYGACTERYWDDEDQQYKARARADRMSWYAEDHDVGYYLGGPTEGGVKGELDGGAVVILSTDFLGGHIVLVRGYTDDSPTQYIVNDPYGDKHQGYPNDEGEGARYTWAEMSPNWYIALYGPEYLPYLYESSSWDSTITVQNGAPDGWFAADVKVCFMNSSGSLNTTRTHSTPVKGIWSLPLSDVSSATSTVREW